MKDHKPGKKQKILGDSNPTKEPDYIEGERLANLLKLIQRGIETARLSDEKLLPEKIWFKQQFAIGINEVTRVLERMTNPQSPPQHTDSKQQNPRGPPVRLQAVVIVADCKPRMLTKHIPNLAASRNVPVVYVRDNRRACLRLGELLKLKTALAIGIKVRGNAINQLLEGVLVRDSPQAIDTVEQDSGEVEAPVIS
ncbi:PREDICTED: ribonuclease P protein subunit p38 [Tarenaya hassleriana]|uniref:ribonuclease P protein subunit p38 n=1 Tax=Tarenaya hassleriana TaxID=28532 RepID=UPI00053C67D8|nr:PREDICTED: ribonuclease P protein subunit p38 [Tarenaya hassleriana]